MSTADREKTTAPRVGLGMGDLAAPVALTLDDAPSVLPRGPALGLDTERMDRVREVLLENGVRHCVAFVIGTAAEDHRAPLRRWLESGYELGNHTYDHPRSRDVPHAAFLESVDRCDRLLDAVGAFEGDRPHWFRFPYLDRGADVASRTELERAIVERGYRVATASLDFFDYRYDVQLAEAELAQDPERARRIGARFVRTAIHATDFQLRGASSRFGRAVPQVAFAHFGPTSARFLRPLVRGLRDRGIPLCALDEALADPVHADFAGDPHRNGLNAVDALDRRLSVRIRRRLLARVDRSSAFGQRLYGPLWPYLA